VKVLGRYEFARVSQSGRHPGSLLCVSFHRGVLNRDP
jgi:hypothetical protein